MKILVVTQRWYPDTFGGSEHVATEQARRLAARGHIVHVVTQRVSDSYPEVVKEGNLTIHRYGEPSERERVGGLSRTDLRGVPKIVRALSREVKFDCAILHHPFPAYGFYKAHSKIPALYIFHTSTAREAEVEGIRKHRGHLFWCLRPILGAAFIARAARVERKVFRHVKKIAVLSDFSRLILEGAYPFSKKKIIKLPIGIDLKEFSARESINAARHKLGLDAKKTLILTVRRFTPRMGLTELILAMEKVLTSLPEAQLLIIGEGSMREELVSMIKTKDLDGKVMLVGTVPVDDLPTYYQAADLFVLPTAAFEGLGMATLEALFCGLPVVGTPAGATLEVLGALDPALITKGTNAEDLAEGIVSFFARSKEERDDLRKRARQVAVEQYDWERAVDELERVLKELR